MKPALDQQAKHRASIGKNDRCDANIFRAIVEKTADLSIWNFQ